MIDLTFLESLISAIDASTIDSIEIERGGTRIRLSKTPAGGAQPAGIYTPPMQVAPQVAQYAVPQLAVPEPAGDAPSAAPASAEAAAPAAGEAPASDLIEITSPMVGTLYRAPAPDAPDYVEVGKTVKVGDTLCILEAMKLMNELECEVSGVIREICVENAEPVEYGQVLFRVSPA